MAKAGDGARGRGTRTRESGRSKSASGEVRPPRSAPQTKLRLEKDGIPSGPAVGAKERDVLFGTGRDSRSGYCTCAMLRRASRRVTQVYDQALKPYGLRLTQYSLLANLLRNGDMSITDLAAFLDMERTTLTRNLKPLEAAGWLCVTAGLDRRSRAVAITPLGQATVEQAFPAWQQAERAFRGAMGRDEAAELRSLLGAAMSAVD